jgi:hypothetical protein
MFTKLCVAPLEKSPQIFNSATYFVPNEFIISLENCPNRLQAIKFVHICELYIGIRVMRSSMHRLAAGKFQPFLLGMPRGSWRVQ